MLLFIIVHVLHKCKPLLICLLCADEGERGRERVTIEKSSSGRTRESVLLAHQGHSSNQRSTGHHSNRTMEEKSTSIDHRLSSHSIFELNPSARGKHSTRSNNSSLSQHSVSSNLHKPSDSHRGSPLHLDGALLLSSTPLANVGCGHVQAPPLTSTPLLAVECGQEQASPTNVTHQDKLEMLAGHYASLITGMNIIIKFCIRMYTLCT